MKNGFTLIELILYIALLTIFLAGAIQFGWNIILSREKATVQMEVNQNLRLAMKRINYEIRDAGGINSVTSSSVSLINPVAARNPTVIDITGGRLRIGQGSSGSCPTSAPCYLTSNLVTTTTAFTNLSSSNSANIRFQLTITHNNTGGRQEWNYTQTATAAAEIRSY